MSGDEDRIHEEEGEESEEDNDSEEEGESDSEFDDPEDFVDNVTDEGKYAEEPLCSRHPWDRRNCVD